MFAAFSCNQLEDMVICMEIPVLYYINCTQNNEGFGTGTQVIKYLASIIAVNVLRQIFLLLLSALESVYEDKNVVCYLSSPDLQTQGYRIL
jgi:hypothetical protein